MASGGAWRENKCPPSLLHQEVAPPVLCCLSCGSCSRSDLFWRTVLIVVSMIFILPYFNSFRKAISCERSPLTLILQMAERVLKCLASLRLSAIVKDLAILMCHVFFSLCRMEAMRAALAPAEPWASALLVRLAALSDSRPLSVNPTSVIELQPHSLGPKTPAVGDTDWSHYTADGDCARDSDTFKDTAMDLNIEFWLYLTTAWIMNHSNPSLGHYSSKVFNLQACTRGPSTEPTRCSLLSL